MANENKPQGILQRVGSAVGALSVLASATFGTAGVARATETIPPNAAAAAAPNNGAAPNPENESYTELLPPAKAGRDALLGRTSQPQAAVAPANTFNLKVDPKFLGGDFAYQMPKFPDFAAEAQAARAQQAAKAAAAANRANARLAAEVKADEGTIGQQGNDLAIATATANQAAKDNANLSTRVSGDEQNATAQQSTIDRLKKTITGLQTSVSNLWKGVIVDGVLAGLVLIGAGIASAYAFAANRRSQTALRTANAAAAAAKRRPAGPAPTPVSPAPTPFSPTPGAPAVAPAVQAPPQLTPAAATPVTPAVAPVAAPVEPANVAPVMFDDGIERSFAGYPDAKWKAVGGGGLAWAAQQKFNENRLAELAKIAKKDPAQARRLLNTTWANEALTAKQREEALAQVERERLAGEQAAAVAAATAAVPAPEKSSTLGDGNPEASRIPDNKARRDKLLNFVAAIGADDGITYEYGPPGGVSKIYVAQEGGPNIHAFTLTDKTITTYTVRGDRKLSKTLEAHSIQIAAAKWNGNFTVTDPKTGQIDPKIEMYAAELTNALINAGKLSDTNGNPMTAKDVVINDKPLTEILNPGVAATAGIGLGAGAAQPATTPVITPVKTKQPILSPRFRLPKLGR